MHKATKEILGRRLGHRPDWVVSEHADGCIEIIAKHHDGVELCSVCINEATRTITAKGIPATRIAPNYRMRDWREVIYIDAIETMKDSIGRVSIDVSATDWIPCRPEEIPIELPKAVLARKSPVHGIVLTAISLSGQEMGHVTVNEKGFRLALGVVIPAEGVGTVIPDGTSRLVRLFETALKVLLAVAPNRACCIVLGRDAATNQSLVRSALRMGGGRLIVIGERCPETSKAEELVSVEYYSSGTTLPKGDICLFDATATIQ